MVASPTHTYTVLAGISTVWLDVAWAGNVDETAKGGWVLATHTRAGTLVASLNMATQGGNASVVVQNRPSIYVAVVIAGGTGHDVNAP